MLQEKSHYSLAEAAELATCKPLDLLHYAVQGKIFLLTGVPDGIDFRTYDEFTNEIGIPFLMKPQLLTVMQSYCLKIELNGRTEQSDFKEGYIIDSSGRLKRLLPSYGRPELNHRWAVWRTFQGESVKCLELISERLFVIHADLITLIDPKIKLEKSEEKKLKTPKENKSNQKNTNNHRSMAEIKIEDPVNFCNDSEPDHRETKPKDIVTTKQPKYKEDNHTESLTKILRLKEVQIRTGLSRSTIYDRLNPKSARHDPTFPKRIHIGSDAVGWIESEIQAWLELRITVSRS